MRISIDNEACTGHGRCYALAPELFEPDDDGRGVVIREEVPEELLATAQRAVASCPESAVKLS
jgi:ferredoxin